jgi:hypothetical protein
MRCVVGNKRDRYMWLTKVEIKESTSRETDFKNRRKKRMVQRECVDDRERERERERPREFTNM